ncbi:hypothetical protein ABNF97_27755 [Plantactinospora sp. B6F1]|uniref:hypothetical protein n=1 Tax=Plantactinospora sp. B6F1 TaxID=3158971 RepID=UPI0032D9653C
MAVKLSDSGAKLEEVLDLLLLLGEARASEPDDSWKARLPRWLLDRFARESTPEENETWLNRWREAPQAQKAEMVNARGWELGEWLYWFQRDNEMWAIVGARIEDQNLIVDIEQADDPVPTSVLRWTCEIAGLRIKSFNRVS